MHQTPSTSILTYKIVFVNIKVMIFNVQILTQIIYHNLQINLILFKESYLSGWEIV